MASKRPQSVAKRNRELALKEKRERKRARKAERAASNGEPVLLDDEVPADGELPGPEDAPVSTESVTGVAS